MKARWSRIAGFFAAAFLAGNVAEACPVIDLETPVEQLAANRSLGPDTRVARYRKDIIALRPAAFAPEVLGSFSAAELDAAIRRSLEQARDPARRKAMRDVERELARAMRRMSATFPDFRCNFPVYFMDSLGRFDGAGRIVAGRPALVLGIDRITAERRILPLDLFLTHELFHRYHWARSGFGDDPGEHQAIWRSLWAEGLATYVSWKMNPGASIDEALIAPPRLAEQARPRLTAIATDLLAHLAAPDHATYVRYFTYGNPQVQRSGLPWRSGYYVGFLVARDLGSRRSLAELAAMSGAQLEDAIAASLRRLAGGGGRRLP